MIYFDNSATTPIYPQALESYVKVSQHYFGNPSSLHQLGETASKLLNQARYQIAKIMGVMPSEIYFTSGGSEGDNWVIKGTARAKSFYGKHLITSKIEHPAVMNTMKELEDQGFEVTYLNVDQKGYIDLEELKDALRPDTILLSLIAVNNEMGVVQPIEAISEILKDYPSVHFHLDAVQTVGQVDLHLGEESRVDMAVFSGHKFHGPRGVGFVYVKSGKNLTPLVEGGGQEGNKRSGTENLPAIVAMAKALRMVTDQAGQSQLPKLRDKLLKGLVKYPDIDLFSPQEGAPHILTFGIQNVRGEVTVHAFEEEDIYLSTTSACSSRSNRESSTLLAMGVKPGHAQTAVRISLSFDNNLEEVDEFLRVLDKVYQQFEPVRQSK